MPVNDTTLATRLSTLESKFDALIVQDRSASKVFGVGRVPFGGSSGTLTDDANLIWDNTNKRLGIGVAAPAATLHVKAAGGSKVLSRIELTGASGDTMLDVFNSDHTIGSGSNFRLSRSDTTTYEQLRGDGAYFIVGPVQIRDNGFTMPAKTALHVSNSNAFGLRVAGSTAGGAMVQNPLTTNAGFARGFFGHNAIWNDSDSLWYIDNIGASDATGIFIPNGGGFEFINVASIGAASQTKSMANFRAAALATLVAGAILDLKNAAAELRVNAVRVVTARQAGWSVMTGTAARTAAATHTAQTISNPPTQAQVQNIDNSLVIVSQRLKALIDDLHATAGHGLIGA